MRTYPKLIGHRGAKGYAPENSLSAIHTAADMGCGWIELDVKLTKDSVPICFHDHSLERLTDADGLIAEMNWREIKTLDYGIHFAESFVGETIPTLEQALDVILERDLALNLEIKPCPGREEETAEAALDILSRSWDDPSKILISAFQPECLDVARHYLNDYPRALLLDQPQKDWDDLAAQLEIASIHIADTPELANEFTIKQFKAKDYLVAVYTVNDQARAQQLFDWDADSIFSDYPDLLE